MKTTQYEKHISIVTCYNVCGGGGGGGGGVTRYMLSIASSPGSQIFN